MNVDYSTNGHDYDRKRRSDDRHESSDKRPRHSSSSSSSRSKDMKSSSSSRKEGSSRDRDYERDYERDKYRDYKEREKRSSSSSRSKERDSKREEDTKRREEEEEEKKKKQVDPEEEMKKRREAWKKRIELLNLQEKGDAAEQQKQLEDKMDISKDQDGFDKKGNEKDESNKKQDKEEESERGGEDEDETAKKGRKMMDLNTEEEDDEVVPETKKLAEDEVDPLDAFMVGIEQQVKHDVAIIHDKLEKQSKQKSMDISSTSSVDKNKNKKNDDDDIEDEGADEEEEESSVLKKWKKKNLPEVDHTKVEYQPFNKKFYIEVPEIAKMTKEEVNKFREENDNIRVRGKECPKPVKAFFQCGLNERVMKVMEKLNYSKPTSIQSQAIPAIMSGRDVIGIAKTGSGKTLSFLLPMIRHILDQPPLEFGDGPIGIIMAPTRELAMQIHSEVSKFCKSVGLRSVCIYGGSGVRDQIADLKRGAEVVVCTPGRMIDVLCANSGRITNLRRVTYLVLDEADRMFDMGFEPQIMRIINNIRPDRQTVLFSATFPRSVESLAKKILSKPIEIVVGGRSVVNSDIDQIVEVISEDKKWDRLIDILKDWYDIGNILIFVHSQEICDKMFTDLMKSGFPCLSLHGGKDQQDRDFTIDDFKRKVQTLMVATSVAARGLDVKDLVLVINYDVPNHMEEYVHRVGRTGRAGNKGTAITLITPDEERFAPDIVRAMEVSGATISADLKALCDSYEQKRKSGQAVATSGSGYGGKGFKFDENEERKREEARKSWKKAYGIEEEEEDDESKLEDEDEESSASTDKQASSTASATSTTSTAAATGGIKTEISFKENKNLPVDIKEAQQRALEIAAQFSRTQLPAGVPGVQPTEHVSDEIEINDYPQQARWRVTHKDALAAITEWTGAAITTRGSYFVPGRNPAPGERKLYLYIEGPDVTTIRNAKTEIKRILEEATLTAAPEKPVYGKYSVV